MHLASRAISGLYLLTFIIYLIWAIDILKLNPKKGVNQGFFFLALALGIWSLGLSLGNAVTSLSQAIFWRRLAAIGRLLIPYLALQFIVLLSYQEKGVSKVGLSLISLPAFILVYVYSFSTKLAPSQYNLQKISLGWTDKVVLSNWSKVYYLYILTYV